MNVSSQIPEQQRRALTVVPQAAPWILLAGDTIYKLCKDDDRSDDEGRGYSLGRWTMWNRKFVEITVTQALSDCAKDIASRAKSEMGRIESSI